MMKRERMDLSAHSTRAIEPARGIAAPGRFLVRSAEAVWTGTAVRVDVSVLVEGGRIAWIGPHADAPADVDDVVDARGALLLPGLVDPHTHTVYAGSRAGDFARRLAGESYTAILEAGGGIHSTVRAVPGVSWPPAA